MTDYLQKVGGGLRILSAIALMAASLLFILLFVLFVVGAVREPRPFRDHIYLLAILALMGFLCVATPYFALRLWRGTLSPNGVTIMPARFLQVFGVLFLAAVVFDVWTRQVGVSFLVEGSLAACAMIFIGRRIARKKATTERSSDPGFSSSRSGLNRDEKDVSSVT